MPQLLGLVLIGAAAVAGFKAIRRVVGNLADEAQRAASKARHQHAEAAGMKDLGNLELDPKSGVYKPREG